MLVGCGKVSQFRQTKKKTHLFYDGDGEGDGEGHGQCDGHVDGHGNLQGLSLSSPDPPSSMIKPL